MNGGPLNSGAYLCVNAIFYTWDSATCRGYPGKLSILIVTLKYCKCRAVWLRLLQRHGILSFVLLLANAEIISIFFHKNKIPWEGGDFQWKSAGFLSILCVAI